ncbi:protein-tyrosine phosphatase family protein [Actimicrobium sp. CCI2.3]|uniref:protein-tyrosine phosphatase family protein n=2 Tax=Bacteria TaxID=2 RepID=UPI002AB4A05A|nr:protein-tyrosine phosphatase family protein [Actimicrobium sp. CCI2.3]MDY7573002.1 protein-tyrosine phosphatase family protein [Actimicrobium sp. CCI2.3]MEB0023875.1 protein-tyrosine phosphatase family protein [Actimicrobium sp. CCI2.3]
MKRVGQYLQRQYSRIVDNVYRKNNHDPCAAPRTQCHKNSEFRKRTDSHLSDDLKNCFKKKTEQEEIEYQLELRRKSERQKLENEKLNGPLSIYHLSELTAKEFNFEKVNKGNKEELYDLFLELEENTYKFKSKWKYVKNFFEDEIKNASVENPVVTCRFPDNVPLVESTAIPDHTRPNVFIHANTMDLGTDRKFIASQRPKGSEIPGFWNAVREHSVSVIIDLTNANDAKDRDWKNYCPTLPFWKMDFKGFRVIKKVLQGEKNTSDFFKENIRQQSLVIHLDNASHSLERINFHQWPDGRVVDPKVLIDLADLAESLAKNKTDPILIHCRAGVGRTGTLMSFMAAREILSKKLAATDTVPDMQAILHTVLEVVAKGRIARGRLFVQEKEQFALIVDALILHFENVKVKPTPLPQNIGVPLAANAAVRLRERIKQSNKTILGKIGTKPRTNALSAITEVDESNLSTAEVKDTVRHLPTAMSGSFVAPLSANKDRSDDQFDAQVEQDIPGIASSVWNTLNVNSPERELDCLNADEVDDNGTNVSCPRHSAVEVDIPGNSKKIHANHVHFQPSRSEVELGLNGNSYIAGQAPRQFDACERLLFKGIESRQGIFQIVSERSQQALVGPDSDRESGRSIRSLIEQLREGMAHNPTLTIGGRYEVDSLEHWLDGTSSSTYLLTVKDTHADNRLISIPLTQTGLKFEDRVLKVPEIAAASEELAAHLAVSDVFYPQAVVEPIIISTAGVGRNATLMVYRQIKSLIGSGEITTEGELHAALLREITIGRNARGPRFVHSEAQLEQLTAALVALLPGQASA